jgi:hypothetical protein
VSAADWEPEIDDIKAMRAENGGADLKAFMRAQIAAGKARREPPPKPAAPKPPGHRPGAWPTGSSPPGPPPEHSMPPEVWADAVRRYRIEQRQQLDEENQ